MKLFEEKIGSLELNDPPTELKQLVLENAASGAKQSVDKKRFAIVGMALSSKWFLFLVLPILLFGSVAVMGLTIEGLSSGSRWAKVSALLEQEGETLDWKSFYPEPVPDDQNFMATPALLGTELRAPNSRPKSLLDLKNERLSALPRFRSRQEESDRFDFAKLDFYESRAKYPRDFHPIGEMEIDGSPEEVVLQMIDADAALFEELAEAAKRPYSQPATSIEDRVKGRKVWSIPTNHLQVMQGLATITPLRALAAARLGDRQKARESLEIFFKCRDCVNSEGVVIDGAVSVAIRAMLERYLPDILREDCWTNEDLLWLQRKVSEGNGFDEGLRFLRGEMAHTAAFFDQYLTLSKAERREHRGGSSPEEMMAITIMPNGIILRNKATAVEWRYQYSIVPFKARDVTAILESEGKLEAEVESLSPYSLTTMLAREYKYGYWFPTNILHSEMQRRMMEVGVALERYRRLTGSFPDTLDALVPQFVEAIPDNLYGEAGNTSLSYIRKGDGYHLSAPKVPSAEKNRWKLDFFR